MPTKGIARDAQDARAAELLRRIADVVLEVGVDGRIVFISDTIEPILARSASSFVGRSFLEFIVAEDRAETLAHFQKVVATGAEPIVRVRVPRRDGLRVEFEITVRSFKDEDDVQRIVCVARDVTQQSAERAVASERDNHYRRIVESGVRPAAILSQSGAVIFSNQRFKATFGRDVGLDDIFQRMTEEDRHAMETVWFDSSRPDHKGSGSGSGDFQYFDDAGESSWYGTTWEVFQNDEGQRNFVVLYEDISQRKKVEHALRSIARGITSKGPGTLERNIEKIAQALGFERLVVGRIDTDDPGTLCVDVSWREGKFCDPERLDLAGLPDAAVARGEAVVYPAGVAQLNPRVAELFGSDFESYAGLPLRQANGSVIGLISGYGRRPIANSELTRSVLSAFATHAAAAVDRQHANEQIRANQDRFEVLARQAHELLVEVDAEMRVTYVSQAAFQILGYRPDDVVGRKIDNLTHPDDHAANRATLSELSASPDPVFFVTRIRHADGRWRWMESRASAFKASDGADRTLVLSRDVTDQRRLDLGRDLLFRVVQQGADLVFIGDPESTLLTFANKAATRRLGLTTSPTPPTPPTPPTFPTPPTLPIPLTSTNPAVEDTDTTPEIRSHEGSEGARGIEGRTFFEMLPAAEAERLRNEILPELTPSQPWSGELQLLGVGDAGPTATEATIFLFQGAEGTRRVYLGITLRDIEARRTAEEALRQSEFRLNQSQKMEAVGRLAGGIAHDFNNLLTTIIGYSDLVLDELGEGHVAQRDAEEILRAAERAAGLTRQLLAFSRRQVLQPAPVDLNAVVANIDRMMRRLIGENIDLVTVQDGELSQIVADPGQIEQVIVNLVVNARDAMPQGGRLEIETANLLADVEQRTETGILPPGHYALLSVSDTGIGMDEETRSQIFEPFFTTKEPHHGTGLGLASVYGIVSQSGGQIGIETNSETGTRFTIYFPATETQTHDPLAAEQIHSRGGHETILLVEDAAPVRRLVRRTLENAGYTVLGAESATAALRHCSRHDGAIHLLLTDVVLPKTAGPEIALRAAELRPGIRVLFMSGFTDETLTRHGLDPSSELLEKPFTPALVLERIRTLLDAPPNPGKAG